MKIAIWLAAALLILPHAASAELGRLFFTQAQRSARYGTQTKHSA
jgi:hypothetical protein